MFRLSDYPQDATYWAVGAPTGYGGYSYTRTSIKCRWEEKQELFSNPQGLTESSRAVVFLMQDVDIDGYLFLGTSSNSDPTSVDGAFQIKNFMHIPDLRNVDVERRAYL